MHSSLTAIVLCIFAQAATAQCLDTPQKAGAAIHANAVVKTSKGMTPAAARPGGELIKTAAAGTHNARAATDEVAQDAFSAQAAPADSGHPPRSEKGMLLAAVALMSGIALRRFSANRQ